MKVYLLVHGLPVGGTEVMVSHLARRWRRNGVEVAIGCLDQIGELGEALREEGFPVEHLERRPGFDRGLPRRIARAVRESGSDLVHAHQYTCFVYGALSKLLSRRPLVFTEHGRFYPDLPSAKRRVFNRFLRRAVDHTTAVSAGVRRALVDVEGFREDRIEVLYNGIEIERFRHAASLPRGELRAEYGLDASSRVLGIVGRLDSIKNHGMLLHASTRLAARVPDFRLVILGDGPERERLEAMSRHLGLEATVLFLGQRSAPERILASFDVFTLASLSEGTPMTILEAMAAGVPVVSTGVGGIPEILEADVEGRLLAGVPPDCRGGVPEREAAAAHVERYASLLEQALTDSATSARLARAASERVEREFSVERISERYLEIFERVSKKRAPRAPNARREERATCSTASGSGAAVDREATE